MSPKELDSNLSERARNVLQHAHEVDAVIFTSDLKDLCDFAFCYSREKERPKIFLYRKYLYQVHHKFSFQV